MSDPHDKEALIRACLSYIGFDLAREPNSLDWVVYDRREGHGVLTALQPTRCSSLESMVDLFEFKIDWSCATLSLW